MNRVYSRLLVVILIFSCSTIFSQDYTETQLDSIKKTITNEKSSLDNINSYFNLSKIYLRKNLDSAMIYVEKGKLLAQKSNNTQMVAVSLIELARIREVQNDIVGSIAALNEAEKLYEDYDADDTFITICNYQGMYYNMLSNYDMAIEKYLLGLKSATVQNNLMYKGVFLCNLSIAYTKVNQFKKSLASILEGSSIFKEIGTESQYFHTLISIGHSYTNLAKYDLAKEHLIKARVFFEKINDHILLGGIYADLGKISTILGDHEGALALLLQAQYHALKMKDYNGEQNYKLALINNNLGNSYLYFKNYSNALKVFKASAKTGKEIKSKEILKKAYKGLYETYLKTNQIDSLNYYLNLFLPVNDSLINEVYNEKLDKLNYNYQLTTAKDKHQKELEIADLSKKRQQLYLSVLIIFLTTCVIIISFIGYAQKNKTLKSKIKNQNLLLEQENLSLKLEKTEKELTTSVLKLVERNEFTSNLIENLNTINFNEDQTEKLKKIIKSASINDSKKLWTEFELVYKQNNKTFFENLNNIAPNISPNERRLIALIKLNFSTKEISSITYQSTHSIKIARYRLRKKLNLEKNQNLNDFFNKI